MQVCVKVVSSQSVSVCCSDPVVLGSCLKAKKAIIDSCNLVLGVSKAIVDSCKLALDTCKLLEDLLKKVVL